MHHQKKYADDWLEVVFQRFKRRVFEQNIVPEKLHSREAQFEPQVLSSHHLIKEIRVQTADYDRSDEAYVLQVEIDEAIIQASAPEGVIRAFDSLAQLFYAHSSSSAEVYTPCAPIRVQDIPAFEYRGLMLDISRNWISPTVSPRECAAMNCTQKALLRQFGKMNVEEQSRYGLHFLLKSTFIKVKGLT